MALLQEEFASLSDDVDLDRDRDLVERCQAGDSGAFGNLYARYYERLLRFCMRRLNDRHEAEDAAQEAFARAWKALPKFAGERRFYPWLTVIAGNICTDMLRRRSRSTPTDDFDMSAQQQIGGSGNETSEELVLAAVDGELVNKALDRLSVRHRHVLAMREGSGWTYQQIADHEGVEIGTIETLLWRARQALKREFTVLSESKGMLGGFLAGAGALLRRGFLRVAHRSADLQQSGVTGGFRGALAGMALTSAAVAAALITPHAMAKPTASASSTTPAALASSGSSLIGGGFTTPGGLTSAGGATGAAGGGGAGAAAGGTGVGSGAGSGSTVNSLLGGLPTSTGGSGTSGLSGVTGGSGLSGPVGGLTGSGSGLTGTASGLTQGVSGTLNGVTGGVSNTVNNLGSLLPPSLLPGLGSSGGGTTETTTTLPLVGSLPPVTVPTLPETVTSTVGSLLGGL